MKQDQVTNHKVFTPFELGEEYSRNGMTIEDNPYLGSRKSHTEFNDGFDSHKRRTHGNFKEQKLP